LLTLQPPTSTLVPYTTLFRSEIEKMRWRQKPSANSTKEQPRPTPPTPSAEVRSSKRRPKGKRKKKKEKPLLSHLHKPAEMTLEEDRKSTRLNSSHLVISYAVF